MFRESDLLYPLDRLIDEAEYAVVGPTDGRVRVPDTSQSPWSAVCHIERDYGDGRLTGCTAFLVGPTTLLTAGHCLMSPMRHLLKIPSRPKRIRITPGRANVASNPFGSQWAASWHVHPRYAKRPNALHDVGVIRLRRPFSPSPGFFRLDTPDDKRFRALRARRLVHISGYPGDKPKGTQWQHEERLDRVTAAQLFYSVDTCPGHSGAPVWMFTDSLDVPRVVAVHTSGPKPHPEGPWGCRPGVPLAPAGLFNRGVRLTPRLLSELGIRIDNVG
jgi:glutamyl endopeptidase